MTDYSKLEAAIVRRLRKAPCNVGDISADKEVASELDAILQARPRPRWSVLSDRLQSLRKSGRIRYAARWELIPTRDESLAELKRRDKRDAQMSRGAP